MISLIALVVALGGTGYAVTQLPKNSVGTAQIKNNAVTGAKVRNNAITGAKVRDGSLTARDFQPGTLLQGPQGPAGAAGATGPPGAPGTPGPRGPATATAAVATSEAVNNLSGGFTAVISLGTAEQGANRTSTGAIQVADPSRLIIQATLEARQVTLQTPGEAVVTACILTVNGANLDAPGIGRPGEATSKAPGDEFQISLTGAVTVQPGTHDVGAACEKSSGGSQIDVERGVLTVVAGEA